MKVGPLGCFARFCLKMKHRGWRSEVPEPTEPCVFVCSHQNLAGPLMTLTFLPFFVRPWVLSVFMERKTCYRQYADYTFSKRHGMPGPLARFLAWCASGAVSALMRSIRGIPVYRGNMRIGATFRQSVEALQAGYSILLFPDVEYTKASEGIGEMYDGFILLGRAYARATGRSLAFYPLYCDMKTRRIVRREPVQYRADAPPNEERVRVKEELHRRLQ